MSDGNIRDPNYVPTIEEALADPAGFVAGMTEVKPERRPDDGGPAFPCEYEIGREVEYDERRETNVFRQLLEARPGMSLRDYFATGVPLGVPAWFEHTPAPGKPEPPPAPEELIGPRPTQDGVEHAAWVAKCNAIYQEQTPAREAFRAAYRAWEHADHLARIAQWRYAVADAMLAARGA
jgi:hypothetical protein